MEIRILNDDQQELWVKPDAAIMKTPSCPREEVFQRIAFAIDSALRGYEKSTKTVLDDRPVVILVSETTIETQEVWSGCPIYIDFSRFTDEQIRTLKFRFNSSLVAETFQTPL